MVVTLSTKSHLFIIRVMAYKVRRILTDVVVHQTAVAAGKEADKVVEAEVVQVLANKQTTYCTL